MSVTYSRAEVVDIIDILYIKIFRLKTSWDFTSIFAFDGNMERRYPDLTYSLKYSFGIDAYTTIDALFSSGKYTFYSLKRQNPEFGTAFNDARKALKAVIPQIDWYRDKMFCHFVEKQSEKEIQEMMLRFPRIFEILSGLQMEAMRLFGVDKSEIRVMPEDKYRRLQEEKQNFQFVLIDGLLDETIRKGKTSEIATNTK